MYNTYIYIYIYIYILLYIYIYIYIYGTALKGSLRHGGGAPTQKTYQVTRFRLFDWLDVHQACYTTCLPLFLRMPGGCSSDQPRVMVGLSGWSAFCGVLMCL